MTAICDFEVHSSTPLLDGPLAIPIDSTTLPVPLAGGLNPWSLAVSDLNIFPGQWGNDLMERPCPVQFEPAPDYNPAAPCGILWVHLQKYTWEATSFPRRYRLRYATYESGATLLATGSATWRSGRPTAISAHPAAQHLRWMRGETESLRYSFPHDKKPHFHPLRSPAGRLLTEDEPRDHPWHHGLCVGFTDIQCPEAGLLSYAFWGEPCQGVLWHDEPRLVSGTVWAGFSQRIIYATQAGKPVFELQLSARHAAVEEKWDWLDLELRFRALEHPVVLASEYGFLKARMNTALQHCRIVDSTGQPNNDAYRALTPSDWVGFEGRLDGAGVGLLMLNHDANPGPKPSADGSCVAREFLADEGTLFGWIGLNPLREGGIAIQPDEALCFRARCVLADRPLTPEFCQAQHTTFNSTPTLHWKSRAKKPC